MVFLSRLSNVLQCQGTEKALSADLLDVMTLYFILTSTYGGPELSGDRLPLKEGYPGLGPCHSRPSGKVPEE